MHSHRTAALLKQIAKKSILPDLTGFTEKKKKTKLCVREFLCFWFVVCAKTLLWHYSVKRASIRR